MSFDNYRILKSYSQKSIRVQDSHIASFKDWCLLQGIDFEKITYSQALEYIDHERARGIRQESIAGKLNSIRIYYDFLLKEKIVDSNIIKSIKLQKSGQKVFGEILSLESLEKIYRDFIGLPPGRFSGAHKGLLHQRNTVILGLLLYQGLDSGAIARLETRHVNLQEGKIYIPGGRKSNPRTLALMPHQILSLKTYLEKTRPQLKRKNGWQSFYLFPVKKPNDMVARILSCVRKLYPEISSSRQLRASVIMGWLKTNNIRQTQYMAGHKNIQSTEKYRRQDLTGLARQLELFHPLE